MKRIGKYGISLLLCLTLLTGCAKINFTTGLSSDEILKISDQTCSLAQAKLLIGIERYNYEKSFGEEIWNQTIDNMEFEEYVKAQVKEEIAQLTCMRNLAKEKNIKLSNSEHEFVTDTAQKYYDELSEEQIQSTKITLKEVEDLVEKYTIATKLYNNITENADIDVSDVDAKVIKVQHIFIKTYDVNEDQEKEYYSKEKIEQAKQKAADLLKQIKDGEDFETLASENSDDKTIEYSFCKSEMIEAFSDAAFALKDGQVSDVIETDDGFYIIKCISSYLPDESVAKKTELIEKKKAEAFKEVYDPFVNTLAPQFNDSAWNKISINSVEKITPDLYDVFEENYSKQ